MTDPRTEILGHIKQTEHWDVIVVGGGASGLGAAVEAASRGHRTLLLERADYAKGTSSRSTKLVHGGVRYLAQGNISLVREALRERGLLRQNAPHLVRDLEFVVPGYSWWSGPFYGVGLKLYDMLAGKLNLGSSRYLDQAATLERIPTLQREGLLGGILYHDGQFDDARLAVTLLRTLEAHGGFALNHAAVIGLHKDEAGRVCGVKWRDEETAEVHDASAAVVINATGVWVDEIRQLEDATARPMLSPSQGVHLMLDKKFLPKNSAIMIPKTDDGRVLFAVPWHDHVVLGTTDTPVQTAEIEPKATEDEIDFILRNAERYMSPAPTRADVLSVFVGLRPLVKAADETDTKAISRDHTVIVSEGGLVTVTGGKWTTYRHMGDDTVNKAEEASSLPSRASVTQNLRLHGACETNEDDHMRVYGTDAALVRALDGAETRLSQALPYSEAEVRWAARFEQARTVEDVLARRLRAQLLNARASIEMAPRVAEVLAEELGRSPEWAAAQVKAYTELTTSHYLP